MKKQMEQNINNKWIWVKDIYTGVPYIIYTHNFSVNLKLFTNN